VRSATSNRLHPGRCSRHSALPKLSAHSRARSTDARPEPGVPSRACSARATSPGALLQRRGDPRRGPCPRAGGSALSVTVRGIAGAAQSQLSRATQFPVDRSHRSQLPQSASAVQPSPGPGPPGQ
jgi:hypothetical protein